MKELILSALLALFTTAAHAETPSGHRQNAGRSTASSCWTETVYPEDGVSMSIASSKYELLAQRPLHNTLQ